MDIVFQVSNDGLGFRYVFPEASDRTHRIQREATAFRFPAKTRAWLQPMAEAKTGFARTNPSYEEYYKKDIPAGTPSPIGAGWVYPGLFRSGEAWLLVSESALSRDYCGTRLIATEGDTAYTVGFPDPRERFPGGPVNPQSTLPWKTPWRLIVVGDLKTVAESMLGVDLATPAKAPAGDWIQPGAAAWSWPLLKDGQTVYDTQKRFIDYAADMGWRYCLIDALWDKQIGYDKVAELADYARGKGVKILLWYNSAGPWNDAPQTPRDRMLTHESRAHEFARLHDMGVAGVKIDFFGGDGQSMIAYYHDIMEDARDAELLVNFHGATLPRGWERTYPNLMTMEAIRGLEFITFEQANADQEPTHAAMLPFTRNVFDPMDFTPMVLDRIPNIHRRTTSAFELALSVLFTSGIQHYAEIPRGMAKAPDYVRAFLRDKPAVWEDVVFLDGLPGKFVAIARRGNGRWYLTGINGQDKPQTLSLDLSQLHGLSPDSGGELITDGDGGNLSFRRASIETGQDRVLKLTLQPHGGFVAVLK